MEPNDFFQTIPRHFRPSNRDNWGDLEAFLNSRPSQSAQSQLAKFRDSLKKIVELAVNEEDRAAATTLLEAVNIEDIRPLNDKIRDRRKRTKVVSSAITAFQTTTVENVGTALHGVVSSFLSGLPDGEAQSSRPSERTLREEAPRQLSEGTATTAHIEILNQRHEWSCRGADLVNQFRNFATKQTQPFSLAHDGIADVTSLGDFAASLSGSVFDDVTDQCPALQDNEEVSRVLDALFPSAKSNFDEASVNADELEKNELVKFVTLVLESYSLFYPHYDTIPTTNERQHFIEVAMPAFRRAFRLVGKDLSLFEVRILGSARRKNEKRVPMVDKVNHAHQADGIVWHNQLQVVLFECSSPVERNADKVFLNHYKLARDMKDTWMYNVEQLILAGRKPPQGLTVFGVHIDARLLKIYTLDLVGCFRLQEIVSLELPVQKMSFQCNFRKLVQVAVAFAHMASAETTRWDSASALEQAQMRKAEQAVKRLPPTNVSPVKSKKVRKTQCQDAEDVDDDE